MLLSKLVRIHLLAILLIAAGMRSSSAQESLPTIGQSMSVYRLADDNTEARGLAFCESRANVSQLYVLDASRRVFAYRAGQESTEAVPPLELLKTFDLSRVTDLSKQASVRGLAFATEEGKGVLYFLTLQSSNGAVQSRLWRYDLDDDSTSSVDLSQYMFRIGDREVFDLAYENGRLLISFDASGYGNPSLRVQRGILRIKWDGVFGDSNPRVDHLPDAGTASARGLAIMQLDGARYLWGTVGNDQIYCADSRAGRGLLFFDRPTSHDDSQSCWGMCFGQNALWVSENVPGPDRVHRVNVTENLDAPFEGPRVPRRLTMTIRSEPESDCEDAGAVYHYYSRPYGYGPLQNQGIWPDTESVMDTSDAENAIIRQITNDPAGDQSSCQTMQCVEYANAPARQYASHYEIDLWTNPYKKFVYPHRVDHDRTELEGTDYLADDPVLYNLADRATYESFINRVAAHIEEKYGVAADMQNSYWAARNVVEYIQDNYYYPNRSKRKPAAVDYARQHYDANPGNLKIELSVRAYDKTQIIACSGTSVMVAGAMRHLGIPARWLGTGTQRGPGEWDTNSNGLLDPQETAPCSNGHRYTQVWLGSHYGWICFDATPSKPAWNDYDPPPPLQPQWRYMTRAAGGHREPKRIVFNVGSELIQPLYRDFEYDAQLAIDNNCGGDQRYNLQGRCENPGLWKLAGHRIQVQNLCFINGITVDDPGAQTRIAWQLDGAWDRIAGATVSLYLQQEIGDSGRWRDVEPVAKEVPSAALATVVDLSAHRGRGFRMIIRRDGDPETGGTSAAFDLD